MGDENVKRSIDGLLAKLIFVYLIFSIAFFIVSAYHFYYSAFKFGLVAFAILSTSIVGGAYVFIKIYIENQLKVMEEDMTQDYKKELKDRLAAQTEEMNKKFAAQTTEMNERFDKQNEEIDKKFKEEVPKIVNLVIDRYIEKSASA